VIMISMALFEQLSLSDRIRQVVSSDSCRLDFLLEDLMLPA
jgi:hypothetical protein